MRIVAAVMFVLWGGLLVAAFLTDEGETVRHASVMSLLWLIVYRQKDK